jgi:thiamine-phosphate pyrophosphorylase
MSALDPRSLEVCVVTSSGLRPGREHLEVGLAAIRGGASAVQLRAPELEEEELVLLAEVLAPACAEAKVLCVLNDRVAVAARVGCSAHVGQDDRPEAARAVLSGSGYLGVSVSDPAEARAAETAGADYLGVTVWSTPTKPEARAVGPNGLRAIVRATSLPVVGIGGIHAGNAAEVLGAGAAGVAVVSAVGAADDPEAATRALVGVVRLWKDGER